MVAVAGDASSPKSHSYVVDELTPVELSVKVTPSFRQTSVSSTVKSAVRLHGTTSASTTTSADTGEVQPSALVTVKLYVPGARSVTVMAAVLPVTAPASIVHVPDGRTLRSTLPV